MSIHELTAAKIKYLVTLLRLDPSGKGVRSIALAKELNVSRPSVSAMLTKLAHEGYLNKTLWHCIPLRKRKRNREDL